MVDPVTMVSCGYFGGSDMDFGFAVAVDGAGNAYVSGETLSTEATFPVTLGPDVTFNGRRHANGTGSSSFKAQRLLTDDREFRRALPDPGP